MQGIENIDEKGLKNPFPGLRPFDVNESHLFYGREHQVQELLRKLSLYRFVSVVGTSGSGKSSLVKAGLLAKLYNGYVTNFGSEWLVATMRPGNDPYSNLASALFSKEVFGENRASEAGTVLHGSSLGLVQLVRTNIPKEKNLLIIIDQFEELFRFTINEDSDEPLEEAGKFVKLFVDAIHQKDVPIYIVITLRSDFLGNCSRFEGLPEAINDGQYLIPRLNRDQIKAAIVEPVNVGHGKIAPRLVQQLLNDVENNQDQLPVLQHALMRTWNYWEKNAEPGEPMDISDYEAIGEMEKALSHHADEAYNELGSEKEKKQAGLIFKSLTVKGSDNRGIRRPTRLKDLSAATLIPEDEILEILNVFRKPGMEFIMPPYNIRIGSDTVVDISHESLMRVWERLKDWVEQEYISAQLYRRISESALRYENGEGGLWRDAELAIAIEWRDKNNPHEGWALQYNNDFGKSMHFLDASVKERNDELAEKKRRRRLTNVVVLLFLISAASLTLWAMKERNTASENERAAIVQEQKAIAAEKLAREQEILAQEKKQEAEKSAIVAETQKQTAEEQRLEAEKQKKKAQQQQLKTEEQKLIAEKAKTEAVKAQEIALKEKSIALDQEKRADSLKNTAELSASNAKRLRMLSIAQNMAIKSIQISPADSSDLKGLLATQAYDFNLQNDGDPADADIFTALYNGYQGYQPQHYNVLSGHDEAVKALAYVGQNSLVSAGNDGQLIMWDISQPQPTRKIIGNEKLNFRALSVSSDSKWLACTSDNNDIYLYDLTNLGPAPKILKGHTDKVYSIVFTKAGLASSGKDGMLYIWDVANEKIIKSLALPSPAIAIDRGKKDKGDVLLLACENKSLYFVNPSERDLNAEHFLTLPINITAACISKDSKWVAAGGKDGNIVLIQVGNTQQLNLTGHKGAINSLSFSNDGKQLASAGMDHTVKLWTVERPEDESVTFNEHSSNVYSAVFSPDDKQLASGGNDKTIVLHPTDEGDLSKGLTQKIKRKFTEAEWNQYVGNDIPFKKY